MRGRPAKHLLASVARNLPLAVMAGWMTAGTAHADVPAQSQTTGSSILMRRPITTRTGTESIPSSTPPTTQPTTPPTGPGTGGQTPTPVTPTSPPVNDGGPSIVTEQPVVSDDPAPPSNENVGWSDYHWRPGKWVGSAVCGQPSVLTRSINCVRHDYGYDSEDLGERPAPASMCEENSYDEKPGNTYRGNAAGCGYHIVKEGYSDWQKDSSYPGTATCSAGAYRSPILSCRSADDTKVDMSYCTNGLDSGGSSVDIDALRAPYRGEDLDGDGVGDGNHESCSAHWEARTGAKACQGSSYMGNVTYACVQDDGTVLEGTKEASCPIGTKPLDHQQSFGSCIESYDYYNHRDYACLAPDKSERTVTYTGDPDTGGYEACLKSGATCCQYRYNDTRRAYEMVGSNSQPEYVGSNFYNDEGEPYQCWSTWECRDLNNDGYFNDGDACWFPVGEAMTCHQNYQRVRTFGASTKLWVPDWSTIDY